MKIEILEPFGYCAGVDRAINIAFKIKRENPNRNVVVLGMLVHNQDALDELEKADIKTIYQEGKPLEDLINQIEENSIVILTAHGHSKQLEDELVRHELPFIDATCPFVTLTFNVIRRAILDHRDVLYLGKKNHPEANAALSLGSKVHLIEPKNIKLEEKYHSPLIISQTTFSASQITESINYIKNEIDDVQISESICQASTLRQKALLELNKNVQLIYVVGGKNSNNTKTLCEIAKQSHPKSKVFLIQNKDDINKKDLLGLDYVAISSGASTPKEVTLGIKEKIQELLN